MCRIEAAVDVGLDPQATQKQDKSKARGLGSGRKQKAARQKGPDGPESVRIAAACLLISFLSSAGFRSAGFLYIGIMDTYGVTRQEASWPLSLIGALTNLSGVIAGPLCQRYPTRPIMFFGAIVASLGMILSFWASTVLQLTITLGVLYGFGVGVVFTVINITLSQYFDKYRAMAFGAVYAGSTLASFVFPNLLLALNQYYPFKGVMLIFGGIILHMCAFAFYIREPSWVNNGSVTDADGKNVVQKATLRESMTIFNEPVFYACLLSNILFQYGFDAFMTTLVDFAVDRGATLQQAVNLLPWFSVADVTGRALFPIMADRGLISRRNLIMTCYLCTGIFTILLPSADNYTELVAFILLMGPFCGCCAVLFCCVVGDCIGVHRSPLAFGVVGTTNGGFFFSKPFFFGHFRDVVQSYDGMFHLTGSMVLFTGVMWVCMNGYKRIRARQRSSKTPMSTDAAAIESVEKDARQPSDVKISIIEVTGLEETPRNEERGI